MTRTLVLLRRFRRTCAFMTVSSDAVIRYHIPIRNLVSSEKESPVASRALVGEATARQSRDHASRLLPPVSYWLPLPRLRLRGRCSLSRPFVSDPRFPRLRSCLPAVPDNLC